MGRTKRSHAMSSLFPAETCPADENADRREYDGKQVTIYRISEFLGNVIKTEARLHEAGRMKYAQYDRAPFAVFTPKRKRRKLRHVSSGYAPFLLIVEGWNAPEPGDMFGERVRSETGCVVSQTRHSSFSDAWQAEFNTMIDPLIESGAVEVVEDFRGKEAA
jgi:hypothetical protein